MPSPETAAASLSITLFGPMQVRVQGLLLPPFRSRKALWVLALLTLRHDRPVERDWLAATLWPDIEQSQAFANMRPILSELRRALGDQGARLQSPDRQTLRLELTDAEVDILTFDAAIKRGKISDLERAVALYHGPVLEGCNEEWIPQERAAREQNCLQALQKLGNTALAAGNYETAAGYYQRAASLDPWSDTARRGWMEALANGGDSNAALQVYRSFVDLLRSDPNAVPDQETSALYQRLRADARQRASARTVITEEAAVVPRITGYLPHPLTDLVGREDERLEVAARLRRFRLVTLTGLGGIGKTRVALEVAREVVKEYADGVWLVTLDSLSDGKQVTPQIASVFGLKEQKGRNLLQSLTEYMRKKRLLLVLDNCEHLLEASAQIAAHLLRECANVHILATSREALGITGETAWAIPSLATPDPAHLPTGNATLQRVLMGYESVQLFVERAQAIQKTFALAGANGRAVAQICSHLEGIPLAIELAAVRVKGMTVEQIAERLQNDLGLLTGGSRVALPRQQTLRATLDWSYALLKDSERLLLRRLSLFAGGWTLEAAEQVTRGGEERSEKSGDARIVSSEDVLDLLTSLVDKSLVVFEEWQTPGRYRMLETVRQYAAESLLKSGEMDLVKVRHRDWFVALAEEAEPHLRGAEQEVWLRRLETEHDNLRAALTWSGMEALGAPVSLRLAGALWRFWYVRGHYSEGRKHLEQALGHADVQAPTSERAKALNGAGALAFDQSDYVSARALFEDSLNIRRQLGDRLGIAEALNNLGNVSSDQSDYAAARSLREESLSIHRLLGDKPGMALTLTNLGNTVSSQGDIASARALYEESLSLRRELGDRLGIGWSLRSLGNVAYIQSDNALARALCEECLTLFRELADRHGIASSLNGLGIMARDEGDFASARALLEESLSIHRELGHRRGIAAALRTLGEVAHAQGDMASARLLLEECLSLVRELGERRGIGWSLTSLGRVFQSQGDLASALARYEEGLSLARDVEDPPGAAAALQCLGDVAYDQGDMASARSRYQESLSVGRELGDRRGSAHCLLRLGRVAQALGEDAAARTLYEESLALFKELEDRTGAEEVVGVLASVTDNGQ